MLKGIGIAITVLAVLLVAVPAVTNCDATWQPLSRLVGAKPMDGMGGAEAAAEPVAHMRCWNSAQAAWWAAVPLGLLGVGMVVTRNKWVLWGLAGGTLALSAVAIAIPTALVGTCGSPDAVCNLLLKPSMILLGGMGIVLAGVAFVAAARQPAEVPLDDGEEDE